MAHGAWPLRALAIGVTHGLAGSAALVVLSLKTVPSVALGLGYIAVFGLGSIAGMALLSTNAPSAQLKTPTPTDSSNCIDFRWRADKQIGTAMTSCRRLAEGQRPEGVPRKLQSRQATPCRWPSVAVDSAP